MSRFSGLATFLLTLGALAALSLVLAWPLWKLATTHKTLYALILGASLVLALGAGTVTRLRRRRRAS